MVQLSRRIGGHLSAGTLFYCREEKKLILKHLGLVLSYLLVEHNAYIQRDTEQCPRPAACYIGNLSLDPLLSIISTERNTDTPKLMYSFGILPSGSTKRRPLYLKTQCVPRCKHFSSRL